MKKIVLALLAVAAVIGALWLLLWAAFPYFYGEVGASRYAQEHRGEAILQVLGAAALLGVAWSCIRHSLAGRTWLMIAGLLVAAGVGRSALRYRQAPEGVEPAGGKWYVVVHHEPAEIDTVYYNLYYKNGAHYQPIHDLVSEYRFVPADCLIFRGLKVSHRPLYVMCGYRSPAGSYDTSTGVATLLALARAQPAFQEGWESIVQQQGFSSTGKP
jgi:hypothetical protein